MLLVNQQPFNHLIKWAHISIRKRKPVHDVGFHPIFVPVKDSRIPSRRQDPKAISLNTLHRFKEIACNFEFPV
jgi:hypothetical protein